MRISDLPRPVTASKADWLPGTTWLGFTPQGKGPNAESQCESTVQRQMEKGYVLERITQSFEEPNPGFENDPRIIQERIEHETLKDSLVAVHKLRHSMRPLEQIVGKDEFDRLQNMWSSDNERRRWAVAFPIVETYEIIDRPKAKDVFTKEVFRRIYQTQSATLRPLDDEARAAIAKLKIKRMDAPNAWIAIDDEIMMAELSNLSPRDQRQMERDLFGALEGETEERRGKIIKRATWLANRFAKERKRHGLLICDECKFDPSMRNDLVGVPARSCFDVHHKNPLAEGERYTTIDDFALLCPTCHRLEHLRLKLSKNNGLRKSSKHHQT
ncbi:HNH endonuclease [uncultured Roseobacter sp.]|uniref:HNH endonuclease n=1 Tax=uncultured Roseobacter sp. TaxID=114847 RepID=UPI00262855B6|nr:HNH endonuclease [uncultured Roseobacter sp.]